MALFLEPSLELLAAILAVLKAGAAYLPLDPEHPRERLDFVLADAGAELIVTDASVCWSACGEIDARAVCLDGDAAELAALSAVEPGQRGSCPRHLAYVIYTSGSTGRPKGVLVEHRQVARLFSATEEWFGFGRARRVDAAALLRVRLQRVGAVGRAGPRRAAGHLAGVDDALAAGARGARGGARRDAC